MLAKSWWLVRVLRSAGWMDRLSMGAQREITKKYARAYQRAGKKDKGQLLDELVAVTGRSGVSLGRGHTGTTP